MSDGRVRLSALALVAIGALALLPRVVVALQYTDAHPYADHPVIDEASYDSWAAEIAAGDWIGDEVFFQEPLYPYWLGSVYAVFGHDRGTARFVQAALGALTAVLVAILAARLFGRGAGVVAGVAAALYRPAILFPSLLLKPNLALPVIAALAICLVAMRERQGAWRWLAVGLLVGLGALLRGNLLILVPVFLLWPFAVSRSEAFRPLAERSEALRPLRAAGYTTLGVALILLPIAWRNLHVGGVFALTTTGAGTNLYGGNNPDNPHGVATEFDWVRGIPEHEAEDWRREAERRLDRDLDPDEVSGYWLGETLRSMRTDPLLHASILWNKLRLTLGAYEVPDNHHLEWDARYLSALRIRTGGFGLWGVLGLAGVGLVLLRGGGPIDRRAALELALFLGLYVATIVLTVTSMRARLAIVPLLLPFAGYFAVSAWTAWRGGDLATRVGARLALSLALAALIVHVPVFDAAERTEELDEREFNLAVLHVDEGRLDEATSIARDLADRRGGSRVATLLADCLFRASRESVAAGDLDGAAALLAEARNRIAPVLVHPDVSRRERFRALSLDGWIALVLGEWDNAIESFELALEFDPGDFELALAHARALALRADWTEGDEATRGLESALAAVEPLSGSGPPEDEARARAQVLRAELELELGRRALEWPGLSTGERGEAQELVRHALEILRGVVREPERAGSAVFDARLAAGRAQLQLGSFDAARRHLRAALVLRPGERTARSLLAEALWRGGTAEVAEREEARRIVVELLDEGEDVGLRALLEEIED